MSASLELKINIRRKPIFGVLFNPYLFLCKALRLEPTYKIIGFMHQWRIGDSNWRNWSKTK